MGTFFLRNDLGFLSFSYLSLKEVALDRRGMVTSPILYPKCMHRYMCMHSLTGKEGDLEVFLCESVTGKRVASWLPGSSLFICIRNCCFSLLSL